MGRFLAIILILICTRIFAQQPNTESGDVISDFLENLSEDTENSDFDLNTFSEGLRELFKHPLNLNRRDYDIILEYGMLSEKQVAALDRHIEQNGKLIAIYELQTIEGFDAETIHKIAPFVKVSGEIDDFKMPLKKLLFSGDHQLFLRYQQVLESQKGFEEPEDSLDDSQRYLGNAAKLYIRYRYTNGQKISYGLTGEKDPGEEFFKGSNKQGFDFYSAHFYMRDFGNMKALAVGDFALSLGQGLIVWQDFGFRKSPFVMSIKQEGRKLKPFTSVNEANFFRGVATNWQFKDIGFTGFISYNRIDANINSIDSLDNEATSVSSLQISGFHRTPNEIADKDAVNQFVTGGNINYGKRNFHIGANLVYTRLSTPLQKEFQPYNQFDFQSDQLLNASLDYKYVFKNFHFFGETALSNNGGFGMLNGLLASIDAHIDIALLHRYYSHDYQSLYAFAFAESTRPVNENGLYFGISIKPIKPLKIEGFVDVYKHPWLKFNIDAPSNGVDYMAQVVYKPSRKMEMYLRGRHEVKKKNLKDNLTIGDITVDERLTRIRYNITYKIGVSWIFKTRAEASFFKNGSNEAQNGFMLLQDINYRPMEFPLSFSARFALFDTDSYDTRIYAYENDLLYVYSIPAYQGRGTRFYLMLRYTIVKGIDVWLRYSQTYINNADVISSGLNEIDGNTRSEIKAQVRFKF